MPSNTPAFPHPMRAKIDGQQLPCEYGMTLRDYFAAAILSAMEVRFNARPEIVAEKVYQFADAMLAEREK